MLTINKSVLKKLWIFSILFLLTALASDASDVNFRFNKLVKKMPPLLKMKKLAQQNDCSFGIYGGTVRDLYLGHKFTIISDLDMVFNSSEKGFPEFRNQLIDYAKELRGKIPGQDFHFDLNPEKIDTERQKLYHKEGITATKVGVMSDDKILDPTGYGCKDLRSKVFRYFPISTTRIAVQNVGRYIRDLIRLHYFRRDPRTVRLMRSSLNYFSSDDTDEGRRIIEIAARCKADLSVDSLVTFSKLISPTRQDVRFLHNGNKNLLTKYFPVDMFFMDIFRSITQADDMDSMRECMRFIGADKFLNNIGFENECKIIMNPKNTRKDLFRRFQFPGFQPKADISQSNLLEQWELRLRKYSYRVLFDMLASEFPPGSREALTLKQKKDDFMRESNWQLIRPGDDFEDMISGFLDPDFNIGVLPREKTIRGFNWFLKTYFPFGKFTLMPLPPVENARTIAARSAKVLKTGYSAEILEIDRTLPHGFRDLDGYLANLTGPELEDLFLHPRTSVAFFDLDQRNTLALLEQLGYQENFLINSAGFSRRKRTILGFNRASNRVIIAYYGFYSDEQLLNHQARIYFLRRKAKQPHPESVFVVRHTNKGFPAKYELNKFITELSQPVHALFIGFVNPLKKILENVEKLQIGDILLIKGYLPLNNSSGKRLVVGLSGFGSNYGSLPANIASLLMQQGTDNLIVIGTGGGLSGVNERYSWVIPNSVYLAGTNKFSPKIPFKNSAALLKLASKYPNLSHCSVATPLVETQALVRKMKERNTGTVDCELYYIVKAAGKMSNPINVFALINVTDFPLSGDEMEEGEKDTYLENSSSQSAQVERALKEICEELGN